jgi:adenosylcobyric acid synthase
LLDVETVLTGDKVLRPVHGELRHGGAFRGYEMHAGRTTGAGLGNPWVSFADGGRDGAVSPDGRIMGAYVHGLFTRTSARAAFLSTFGMAPQIGDYDAVVDAALDEIASELGVAFDVSALARLAEVETRV